MLYQTLRAAARVALRWYYADVIVQGRNRIPARGPLLIVANHPNALVDALLVGTIIERRVLLTAKATLFERPALAALLSSVGVVPLRRAKDEPAAGESRNALTFQRVTEALRHEGAVLIFPEGISHDEPALAPLRTGAARMALEARGAGTNALRVLPVGLVFEEKERPRSRVLVRIGEPLEIDTWCAAHPSGDAALLTREIDARLRQVTLNFATTDRAIRAVRVAAALAAISSAPPDLGDMSTFALEAEIADRIERATNALAVASPEIIGAADHLTERLVALEKVLHARGGSLADARISLRARHGARFLIREGVIAIVALPIALLGRLVHWLPFRLARAVALSSLRDDPSRDQPAMRTIVIGLGVVFAWYTLQAALVERWLGIGAAAVWLVIIFLAAQIDLWISERLRRAWRRAQTYLLLRRDSALRTTVLGEIDQLLHDALHLERVLTT